MWLIQTCIKYPKHINPRKHQYAKWIVRVVHMSFGNGQGVRLLEHVR